MVKEITAYSFDELSDEAKEKAREWFRVGGFLDYDWWDGVESDFKEIGKIIGIRVDKIYFSGFSSQGDGAQFEGYYEYAKQSVKNLKEYAPQDTELHRIVKGLYEIQKENFYQLTASVKHSGHYYHELCTDIDVSTKESSYTTKENEETIKELLRDLMHWLYRTLEKEYEYLNSDEQVDETIRMNEYTFTESGERFG